MAPHTPKIALLIETSKSYGRGILRGIDRYVKEHVPWSLYLEPRALGTLPPPWLGRWKGDGIIARISDPKIAEIVLNVDLPTVNLSSAMPDLKFPCIESSPRTQARMAACHLLERGFQNFAFCGDGGQFNNWSLRVEGYFRAFLRHSGRSGMTIADRYLGKSRYDWDSEQDALAEWIARLPKPIGVLAINDPTGLRVLEACQRAGAMVPEQVGVIGLENDDLVCSMSDPPLSSLMLNSQQVGFQAAELLDNLMAGKPTPDRIISVEPIGIVTRQSTDIQAHPDEVVAKAIRFIRNRACEGINVEDVLQEVKVSRSSLDRRFKTALGRSPHEEIVRAQLKVAMKLLAETELNLLDIAIKTGYNHPEYMGVVFRRELGITPGEYRRQAANSPLGKVPEL
ncbi:MAG: substrate-binding domain-containing protein [Pirellulales bacterium]